MSLESANRRIWVTRTQPQAQTTAERLRALGWTAVVAPVLAIRPLSVNLDNLIVTTDHVPADVLAFTSQAAVVAYARLDGRRDHRVFAVGEATARMAAEVGFGWVEGPGPGEIGDVEALAERIAAATPRPRLVLNPTARRPAADLAALLAERGVEARSVAVYETVEVGPVDAPEDLAGVLVHSPRAAQILARRIGLQAAARLTVWAISEAAAEPLRALGFARIFVAAEPSEAALLAQLQD